MMIRQIAAGLVAMLIAMGIGVVSTGPDDAEWVTAAPAAEDDIAIMVLLRTEDDVCVLSWDYRLDGEVIGGGSVCNANERTPLYENLIIFENSSMYDLPEGADLSDLSLTFSLRNSFDGADIPVENEIRPEPELGKTCLVTISGGADEGYRAE